MNHVITVGTFDILHYGHLNLLRECRRIAGPKGWVSVGVNSDEVAESRGKRIVQTGLHRELVVGALRHVDHTFLYYNGPDKIVRRFNSKIDGPAAVAGYRFLVVGDDWAPTDRYLKLLGVARDWLFEHQISLIFVPHTMGVSSTELRARARE